MGGRRLSYSVVQGTASLGDGLSLTPAMVLREETPSSLNRRRLECEAEDCTAVAVGGPDRLGGTGCAWG